MRPNQTEQKITRMLLRLRLGRSEIMWEIGSINGCPVSGGTTSTGTFGPVITAAAVGNGSFSSTRVSCRFGLSPDDGSSSTGSLMVFASSETGRFVLIPSPGYVGRAMHTQLQPRR